MANQSVKYITNGPDYSTDQGQQIPDFKGVLKRPADVTEAEMDVLLDFAGLRTRTDLDASPCPNAFDTEFRKLVFTRRNGNSFSLVLGARNQGTTVALNIRDWFQTNKPDNPVRCIELIGEKTQDLTLLLQTRTTAPVVGDSSRTPPLDGQGKQFKHSGKIAYQFDGRIAGGDTAVVNVQVDTNVLTADVTSPPSVLLAQWDNCVGPFEANNPCPSKSNIEHRRYILTLLVEDTWIPGLGYYQTTEVPVRAFDAPEIFTCGRNLANLASTVCIGYRGESNSRFLELL